MLNYLHKIWVFQIQVFPVLFSLLVYFTPTWLRKAKQWCYAPIHFAIFPFRSLNPLLEEYDNTRYTDGDSSRKVIVLKKQIRTTAILSAVIDAIFLPLFVGVVLSSFLSQKILWQFLLVLICIRGRQLFESWTQLRYSFSFLTNGEKLVKWLAITYTLYLIISVDLIHLSHQWAHPLIVSSGIEGLFKEIKFIIYRLGVEIILVTSLSSWFTSQFLAGWKSDEDDPTDI